MLISFQQHDAVEQDIVVAPKNKLKILFYHAGGHTAWLYPAALQLKTYIDLFATMRPAQSADHIIAASASILFS